MFLPVIPVCCNVAMAKGADDEYICPICKSTLVLADKNGQEKKSKR